VDARKVAVENDDVVAGNGKVEERVVALERDVDCHPFAAQAGRDRPGQHFEVLNDQHLHRAAHDASSRVATGCQPPTPC
jgi:hypothetical protein